MNRPWIAAALLLTACAAQPRLPAETEYPATVVGRVAQRTVAGSVPIVDPKENPTATTYTPHSPIPMVTSSGEVIRARPRIAYELRANDGALLIVQATSDFPVGACVVLSGYADGPSRTHFSFGQARLEPSDQCDPQAALIEPRRMLTGMFVYMADAALITLCADGARLPVAMEADYKALEAAYLKERPQPGQALLASLEGRIAPRPSMEDNQPPRPSLVVERFINIWPRETCGNPLVDSPLRGTYWKLVRLNDAPVRVTEKQREPHLIFADDESRVSGSGGCNRVTGGFELDGDKLRLRRMAGTMMACVDGMEQEQRFLRSLEKVERYRISGSHLEMLDGAGAAIARFEAVHRRTSLGHRDRVADDPGCSRGTSVIETS